MHQYVAFSTKKFQNFLGRLGARPLFAGALPVGCDWRRSSSNWSVTSVLYWHSMTDSSKMWTTSAKYLRISQARDHFSILAGIQSVCANHIRTEAIKILYDGVNVGSWKCWDAQTNAVTTQRLSCRCRRCINESWSFNNVQFGSRKEKFWKSTSSALQ